MTHDDRRHSDDELRRLIDAGVTGADRSNAWADFVDECRAGQRLDQLELERDAARVVEAVLAQTVREDLGWRGDLRLVGGFVSRRLRSSALLRFAAASLLVHLIALPVLAVYRVWKAEPAEHQLQIDFQSQPDLPYDLAADGDGDDADFLDEGGEVLPALDALDAASLEVQNALNADRWTIFERNEGLRRVADRAWDSDLERRLASRARSLVDGTPPSHSPRLADAHLERLIGIDERLDARLHGEPVLVDAADLAWLAREAAGDPPRAAVALAVLERARRYGLELPEDGDRLVGRLQTPELAAFSGLSTAAGRAPLSAEWVRALRSASLAGTVSPDFETLLRR